MIKIELRAKHKYIPTTSVVEFTLVENVKQNGVLFDDYVKELMNDLGVSTRDDIELTAKTTIIGQA